MEDSVTKEFEIFKEAIREENLEMQIETTKHLGTMAKHLGEEMTRTELLPFIKENINVHDEILLSISEQLKEFIPLVGGSEHSQPVMELLIKLCNVEENRVRDKTVDTLRSIADNLSDEQVEKLFVPVVEALSNDDWFTSKCSAVALYPNIYPRVQNEKKIDLLNNFRNLIQDEFPLVRKAAAVSLVALIPILEVSSLKDQFVPVFDNIAKDSADSVQVHAVDIALALASRLSENEIEEFIFKTVESWADHPSWRLRYRLALSIAEIQSVIPYGKTRGKILAMFQKLIKDDENEVKMVATQNLVNYCQSLKKTYDGKEEDNFEPVFLQSILPHIHNLTTNPSDNIRLVLSTQIISLNTILREDFFKEHLLPVIIDVLQNECSTDIQSNILESLNYLPGGADITQRFYFLKDVLRSLVVNSSTHWRIRRSLLVTFVHLARITKKEYFSENFKVFYAALLGDPVFAVRRTASVIIPLLSKEYGLEWTSEHIIPYLMMFKKDCKYLYRYVPLYGILELIYSSLDTQKDTQYLNDLKNLIKNTNEEVALKAIKLLAKLVKGIDRIKDRFQEQLIIDILSLNKSIDDFKTDNIQLYAEDTLYILRENYCNNIFSINEKEINSSYLEKLLQLIYTQFIDTALGLFDDPIVNVQVRAIHTLYKLKEFIDSVYDEINDPFVTESLNRLSEADIDAITEDINSQFYQKVVQNNLDTELMDCNYKDINMDLLNNNPQVPDIVVDNVDEKHGLENYSEENGNIVENNDQESSVMAVGEATMNGNEENERKEVRNVVEEELNKSETDGNIS